MTYFAKLPITIDLPQFNKAGWPLVQVADVPDRARYKYTLWENEEAPPTPLYVYAVPDNLASSILAQLPSAITDREVPGVFYIEMTKPHPDSTVPPHVDVGRRTAINIYTQCAGELTEFFEADDDNCRLVSQGGFIAEPNDVWLLNVSKPHAVRESTGDARSCISLSFRKLRAETIEQLMKDV